MTNWKTTLAGLGFGAAYVLLTGLQSGLSIKDALIGAAIAALGVLAKDFDVTGVGNNATRWRE